jgi:hypothetical protein
MTSEAAKDLTALLVVLVIIITVMMAMGRRWQDLDKDPESAWYYQRVAPHSHGAPDSHGQER